MGPMLSPKWVQTMPIIGPQNAQYCTCVVVIQQWLIFWVVCEQCGPT